MTRVLSELLGAKEPAFRLGIRQLERASGEPNADIRLSAEINTSVHQKLRELGLDPHDTTGQELYSALMERIKNDDALVRELLGNDANADDLMPSVQRFVQSMDIPKNCFALKISAAKRLLKKFPPKHAMKQLGYRSVDSMLKHEPALQLYAAAWISESAMWHKNILASYKQLGPTDFESREVAICAPQNKRWKDLSESYVERAKHNIIYFKELGSIILLPLDANKVDGLALTSLVLTLNDIADIRATSAYLKLHQVRSDFGQILAKVSHSDPQTSAELAGQALPWKLVQRYFAKDEAYNSEIFEPHVQAEDLHWQPVENILAKLHESFEFWRDGAHVGLLDNGSTVSFNLTDAALNFCNKIPYEQRIVRYLRDHLWHELMLRYMHQQNVETSVERQLTDEMIDKTALV